MMAASSQWWPRLVARIGHLIDRLYRWRLGWLFDHRFALLTHVGRRRGRQNRHLPRRALPAAGQAPGQAGGSGRDLLPYSRRRARASVNTGGGGQPWRGMCRFWSPTD